MSAYGPKGRWRRYFGYRPPRFEPIPFSAGRLQQQADAYVAWLAQARGWTIEQALAHIASQAPKPKSTPAPIEPPLLAA